MGVIDPRVAVKTLGGCKVLSPFYEHVMKTSARDRGFLCDSERVLYDVTTCGAEITGEECGHEYCPEKEDLPTSFSFERAGPREKIYFRPADVRAGIVTCGGLCPGLNNVIYALTTALWRNYQVREIFGFRFGYAGLVADSGYAPVRLDPDMVDGWTGLGGTKLGSSRGNQDPRRMVDFLEKNEINILFAVGGDGTMRGALDIAEEIDRRAAKISLIGIPKTIDNDIVFLDTTFGYRTAVEVAAKAIESAHVESKGAPNCVGLVKLMGRDSGFIACAASLATGYPNYVLIPEQPVNLDKFLTSLKRRLFKRQHAVVVVAEGVGQELMQAENAPKDASGNAVYGDIGLFLKNAIAQRFKQEKFEHSIKYIDPSYTIRSVPANADDAVYCLHLGQDAVHAAMAGKTEILLGSVNGKMVHLPIGLIVNKRKKVDLFSPLWRMVTQMTEQLDIFADNAPED
ncbi:ATP-dependent 6-phosphofructokinase [Planctomycetales bacterium]|nr:ATP-dependent 6-phosphofructokinase [Planctomycetales bacterium]